jgi:hypothetical protein
MATRGLLEYVCDRVIERLVERVPGATEESERAWFDWMIEDWIRARALSLDATGLLWYYVKCTAKCTVIRPVWVHMKEVSP